MPWCLCHRHREAGRPKPICDLFILESVRARADDSTSKNARQSRQALNYNDRFLYKRFNLLLLRPAFPPEEDVKPCVAAHVGAELVVDPVDAELDEVSAKLDRLDGSDPLTECDIDGDEASLPVGLGLLFLVCLEEGDDCSELGGELGAAPACVGREDE
jgi:hypothetical protein